MSEIGVWRVIDGKPTRVPRAGIDLERDLENWIQLNPGLLADGLRIVGRQVQLDGGPLDLLGIDGRGRWIVVELNRDRLHREALIQAIDYAASVSALQSDRLQEKVAPFVGTNAVLSELVAETQREESEGEREVAIVLAGARVDPHLERMTEFLADFGFPVSIVTFDLFRSGSDTILIREITEEGEPERRSIQTPRTIEAISAKANAAGVGDAFRELVSLAENAGLHVKPYIRGVAITHPDHRNYTLMWAHPKTEGRLYLEHAPGTFEDFFPNLPAGRVEEIFGSYEPHDLVGAEIRDYIDRTQRLFGELLGTETEPA